MRFALTLVLLCAANLPAQQPAPSQVFGSVTVHAVLADTNQPARQAGVTLQSADEPIPSPSFALRAKPGSPAPVPMTAYKTGLDGSLLIPQVAPGRYYVVLQQSGYLSLVSQFTREEVNHPDAETKARLEATYPVVVVAAHQGSTINVRLIRGATVSGTLRYDDGAPVPNQTVFTYRHTKTGDWAPGPVDTSPKTDDRGHFHASGLAAGEYRLQTQIAISPGQVNGNSVFGGFAMPGHDYYLTFYLGDGIRAATARTIKLGEGENSTGNDITIPVARLHSVSGTLIAARNGEIINSGRIALFLGDDKNPSAFARVGEDSTFHFDFILEGDYTLKVSQAKVIRRDAIASAQPYAPQFKEVPLKSYGDYQAPFKVQSDMTGVTLPIPEAKPERPHK